MERRDAQFAGTYLAMRQSILKDGLGECRRGVQQTCRNAISASMSA
jgi:hypothetical protein